ncbi:DNA-binding MarR family transcriptional regulator [Paraburkholderia tropica]|uniref:MarR family winged helix-turn-helix transcriptional regulator n=1 Tax=Paraburkholderia tropica TaxID=92647 RepID=UPI001CB31C91|nr:MarR family transcriptional regulator [Paraburkholderia tropica]CAG9230998.1 DNA-binding MarR family transcriptional regulator [Paraburkholderia tropica]
MRNTTKRSAKIGTESTPPGTPAIPAPGEGKRGETGYLGYLLRQAGAAHRLRMERALADLGITPPQFVVLTMLVAYPGISGADLARLAALTPQTVSVIVGNLERDGAIERRPHPVHGRIQQIDATVAGLALLKQCRARVKKLEAQMIDGFTPGEEQVIRRWLASLARDGEA